MLQASPSTESCQSHQTPEEASRLVDMYTLLSQLMRYPEESAIVTAMVEAQIELAGALDWQREAEDVRQWRQQCPDLLHDLRLEYTRLFITAARRNTTVPPYASVYLDSDALLQGRTTERIHDFYRSCGYELAAESEPADHIWLQLNFLAALARDANFEAEEQFLRTFFRPWFVIFKEKCFQATAHPVYRLTLILIDFFTKEEQ
ncbi:MAG: hypothetical protein GX087_01650 [Desulfobulbaceae bacterium]|nr:hypothetical protein [Desulfobulbaceae bacterium]